ncbi:MAG: tRNA (adenosine(37)-N6)-threonylcarbamoyltransferase complex ATPase subunit type 1 TsaE, partial [Pseudomonadota bacterium]
IGYYDYLEEALCLIEWPEKAEMALPETRLDIHIEKVDADNECRRLTLVPQGDYSLDKFKL